MTLLDTFKKNFSYIINDINDYKIIRDYCIKSNNNCLLYSYYGFPFDYFIDDIIKKKFNISNIYKTENIWNKTIIYNENQYFFEIDLDNPNMPKKLNNLTDMLLFIIKSKAINNNKHLIIIKNIDKLEEYSFAFRIILERYFNNCYFICTTNKINKIENPIKSRFSLFRIRLFSNLEINNIFDKYLNIKLNKFLIDNNCRNIFFAIFIAQTEIYEPHLITEDFCNFNYPPIKSFYNSNYSINDIRQLSYKYSQYNLTIKDLLLDLLKLNKKKYHFIIHNCVKIEELLLKSNKGKEPIYIEALLCQLFL
jgi:hypothetical protein